MQLARPAFAPSPKFFGKGRRYDLSAPGTDARIAIPDDVKLFAVTFLAGFAFVSILIG